MPWACTLVQNEVHAAREVHSDASQFRHAMTFVIDGKCFPVARKVRTEDPLTGVGVDGFGIELGRIQSTMRRDSPSMKRPLFEPVVRLPFLRAWEPLSLLVSIRRMG